MHMIERIVFICIMFALVEGAALYDAYELHPMKAPAIHSPTGQQLALQLAAVDVATHALKPARRHQ